MDETGLELARPRCKGYRVKRRRVFRRKVMGVSRTSPFWNRKMLKIDLLSLKQNVFLNSRHLFNQKHSKR